VIAYIQISVLFLEEAFSKVIYVSVWSYWECV